MINKTARKFTFALILGLGLAAPLAVSALQNDGVEDLNEEQQAMAARFLAFQDHMDKKVFDRARELNGGSQEMTDQKFDYDFARYEGKVGRGPVVEKVGRMIGAVLKPGADFMSPTTFSRYYGIDIHSKSPLMGMVHAAIVFQYHPDGGGHVGGTVSMLRGGSQDEDLQIIKETMDKVFEKHGVDGTVYRERLCDGTETAHEGSQYARKLACVGGTFFGNPMFEVTEENYLFMTDFYETFIDAYFDAVERRKDQAFNEEDIAVQDAMRKNWFEDQTFGDPYSSSGITPYEVWGLTFLPPVVKF